MPFLRYQHLDVHCARRAGRCLAILTMLLVPLSAFGNDKVRLQLKWEHQFQFAGYYAAKEQGYYRQAGLDVEIIPGKPDDDPMQRVLQGKAEFGVGTTDLLLLREKGEPVVALAAIFQHSPLALMSLKKDGLQSIHDLAGRKVMIEPGAAELFAYLRNEGVSSDKLMLLPHSSKVQDLISGKVDAMSMYVTVEPIDLEDSGKDYVIYSPRAVGIDFYNDILFTTENLIKQQPELVKAFREASLKGWEYAMQHPEELIRLIYTRYGQRKSLEHLRFEARQMVPLLQASLVEIGHMNPGRWRHIAEVYAGLGMMKPDFDFTGFLYEPYRPPPDLRRIYGGLAAAALLVLIASATALRFVRLSTTLKNTIAESKQINEALEKSNRLLESLSITDGLTGLANRRRFDEVLAQEHARHARSEAVLSLIMLDIDHFKAYNDCYGHVSGDDCLRRIARVIADSVVRAADFAARYGGEEFACILPETDMDGAVAIAEKIRRGIMDLAIPHCSSPTADCVTTSLGVVTIRCSADIPASDIVVLADKMLYKAKHGGRNRFEVDASHIGPKRPAHEMEGSLVQLVWKETFCSGNHLIDAQHRKLFNISNELLEAILSVRPNHEISALAARLLDDVVQHFREEETILERAKFPGLKRHAEEHARLHNMALGLAQALDAGSAAVGDVFKFLVYDMVLQRRIGSFSPLSAMD